MNKRLVALLASVFIFVGCTGCSFRGHEEQKGYDPTKTYLYIGNYDGGLGHAWLEQVASEYMALHEDVVIRIDNKKDEFGDVTLLESINNYSNDLYFVNGVTYSNYVARNVMADITDVVTAELEGEGTTIEQKMNPTLANYYKRNDKYYAVPFFDSIFGTMYDVDLFEDEGLYFNTDGVLMYRATGNTTKSAGPNGVAGDYDDGLPATFSQWKTLVDTMKKMSIIPYIWTGEYVYYRYRWLTSIWADYEGKANFDLNMSFNGSYKFDGDESATPIKVNNAYLLQKQLGKKYALDYAEYIIRNNMYKSTSFTSTNTHLMAQNSYLLSVEDTSSERIAMILEGTWWENEAKEFFDAMAKEYGSEYAFKTRRFGFMPTPKSDDGKSDNGTTLISSTANSVAFITARTQVMELAKDFLKFAHTESALRTFTRMTGAVRPYEYTLTDSDKEEMSYYAKNIWDMYHDTKTDISYVTIFENNYVSEKSTFLGPNNEKWWWQSTVGSKSYTDAMYEFWQETSLNAQNYFDGLQTTFSQSEWNAKMSEYFD